MEYYATFASGFHTVVRDYIAESMPDAKITRALDGAVIFESGRPPGKLQAKCFNNVFLVLDESSSKPRADGQAALESYMNGLTKGASPAKTPARRENPGRPARGSAQIQTRAKPVLESAGSTGSAKSFRILTSFGNRPTPVNERVRRALEGKIAAETGLVLSRAKADAEYWVLCRSEGLSLFMKRLTAGKKDCESPARRGELRPEIAFMLLYLARPEAGHTVLDPFCGSGAIPIRCAANFRSGTVCAFDADGGKVGALRGRLKNPEFARLGDRLRCERADIREIAAILGKDSVHRIVTDPPWGFTAAGRPR